MFVLVTRFINNLIIILGVIKKQLTIKID